MQNEYFFEEIPYTYHIISIDITQGMVEKLFMFKGPDVQGDRLSTLLDYIDFNSESCELVPRHSFSNKVLCTLENLFHSEQSWGNFLLTFAFTFHPYLHQKSEWCLYYTTPGTLSI